MTSHGFMELESDPDGIDGGADPAADGVVQSV